MTQILPTFTWQAPDQIAHWFSANDAPVPKILELVDDTLTADLAYRYAIQSRYMLWQGDYQNGLQMLQAMSRRIDRRKPSKNKPETPLDHFHHYRLQQSQRAQIINRLLVKIEVDGTLNLGRAPEVSQACKEAFGSQTGAVILPLQTLLGILGAHEWYKKGVEIKALGDKIHVPYGLFSPIRGEYLTLLAKAEFPDHCESAIDVGTGSGVIAALLAKRGIPNIVGTDLNPNAINVAKDNCERLGYSDQVKLMEANLFLEGMSADLIVCNPPWIPAKPTSVLEQSLYDFKNGMLQAFLKEAPKHLNEKGEIWLIMSDFAERVGLREKSYLTDLFKQNGLKLKAQSSIQPSHPKTEDKNDPLHQARSEEMTSLYQLIKTGDC